MQINTKCKLGDEVWFFRSGNKVDKFSEITCGKVIGININVKDESIFITYFIKDIAGEVGWREEDRIYDDFMWISMVSAQNESTAENDVKKAYKLLGKALGLV